jgi:hypothetical protein
MSTTPLRVGFIRQNDKHTLEAQKASMKRAGITRIYTDLALCIRQRRKAERDIVAIHKGMLLADPSDKRRLGGMRGSFWRNLDKLEAAGAVLWEVATNRSTATKRERDLITREAVDDLARTRRYDRAGRPPREWSPSDLAIMRLHWFSREHATNKDAIRAMAADGLHVTESMVLKKMGRSGRSPGPKSSTR